MSHNCFISFKKEDEYYKNMIVNKLDKESIVGKSLDVWIDSEDIDYVMQRIRNEYMNNTSVTLYIIGEHSSENEGFDYNKKDCCNYNKQNFLIRELQATLYDGKGNRRAGLLGIVLPSMYDKIYGGSYICSQCRSVVSIVKVDDSTVLREFSQNYYLASTCKDGHCSEDERYCVLVKYDDFMKDPQFYIDKAFEKTNAYISDLVHWKDIEHTYKR